MIFYELITNFILALVAVTILSMVVLGRVVIVLLVSVTVVRPEDFSCVESAHASNQHAVPKYKTCTSSMSMSLPSVI